MNRAHKIRLISILMIILLLSIACGLILFALKQNINLFYTPSELSQIKLPNDQIIRIGGYVKMHSVQYDEKAHHVLFVVTDRSHEIKVNYDGVLPNLFREGQTVVVTGSLHSTTFFASEVLAKHDEKYMPKVLADQLKGKNHVA